MKENKINIVVAEHEGMNYTFATKDAGKAIKVFRDLKEKGIPVSVSSIELEDFSEIIQLQNEL